MQDKCEKKDCDEPRTCLHYCDKHHQEICLNGHATLQEFLAAQQKMHPTLGESAASDSESKSAPKRVI